MATVMAGFAGVVMMLRPTIDQNQLFAGLVGLLSGWAPQWPTCRSPRWAAWRA
jgi:hypothetical protein